jgi:hypothetical protein
MAKEGQTNTIVKEGQINTMAKGQTNTKDIKEGQTTQWTKEKGQTMIHKTLQRKLKI